MISKLFFNFNTKRYIHRYVFKMDKAYLRRLADSDQFQLSFEYVSEELKLKRQFNFCRSMSETVENFLARIATNIEKVLDKKKNRNKNDTVSTKKLLVSLFVNNSESQQQIMCKEVFIPENDILLSINDKKYRIIVNSPWIESLCLPNSIMANFPTYPSKFEAVSTNKKLSEFIWFKSKDKNKWQEIYRGYMYIPKNEDIECYLKLECTPKNENLTGPAVNVTSSCKVEASPGLCPFDSRHQYTACWLKDKEFRVVTYNILADLYCDSDYSREVLFPYCPPYALDIDYRKQLILKEIIGYHADIICLQEVDRKVFKYDLEPTLSYYDYGNNFSLKGGEVAEGLAFFYNEKRFKLLHSEQYVFSEHIDKEPLFSDIWKRIQTNNQLKERILARTTTLQVNVVQSIEHNEILIVANSHLYFHPDADHIRLLHAGLAIKYLEHIAFNLKTKYPKQRVSLVFCGDFNSVPECGIYKLYTTGSVPGNYIDYSSNKEETIENVDITQSFHLLSACGTPKYTNFTAGFADCLDYIFVEKTNLEVVQAVPTPSYEELTQHTAIPSIVSPSDHIALISDLKWI